MSRNIDDLNFFQLRDLAKELGIPHVAVTIPVLRGRVTAELKRREETGEAKSGPETVTEEPKEQAIKETPKKAEKKAEKVKEPKPEKVKDPVGQDIDPKKVAEILGMPYRRHVKMFKLKQLGLKNIEIVNTLGGTNGSAVRQELVKYENDPARVEAANQLKP